MTPTLHDHLLTMARYNVWATRRLYQHVDALSDDDYRRDVGLFFGSVHGTLSHLYVAEHLLWWERFVHGRSPRVALDARPLDDRAELRGQLLAGAQRWQPFIESLREDTLAGRLDYTSMKGVSMSLPYAATLSHVFNHGTHHRGQVTAALTALGQACPELDLVWMLQEEMS